MNQKKVDLVIVNWNSGFQLEDAVKSINQRYHAAVSSVIIVDNGSTDDSLDRVAALLGLFFKLIIIKNIENRGFGAACNQGAELTENEFILFLNPDTRLFEDSLLLPLAFLEREENSRVGILGIQLIDESQQIARSCARFPTAVGIINHALGLDRLMPSLGHFMREWDHATTRPVDHVIGAFFLLRNSTFIAIGGFDETFFVYLEDLDFSYRAKQVGWSSVFFAEAQAFHAGGGTSRQVMAKRLYYSLRSRILYAYKHFNPVAASLVLLVTFFIEPIVRTGFAIFRRSWSSIGETWLAYRMLFRWLPEWILKGTTR